MKLNTWLILALGGNCLAAQYAIDRSCDNTNEIKSRDGIVGAMQEAVDLADNAFKVMTDHRSDDKVQSMCKYILGADDFENKFNKAKAVFEAVKAYSREPSQFRPQDEGWKATRSNIDIELYCDASRFVDVEGKTIKRDTSMERGFLTAWYNAIVKCHDPKTVPGPGTTIAMTWTSDFTDIAAWIKAGGSSKGISKGPYTKPTKYANTMDLCAWYMMRAAADQWPKIDAARIEKAMSKEFVKALKDTQTPVDGILQTFGAVLLHELTHTNQGGKLEDVKDNDLPDGTKKCYGWKCVGALHSVNNADSINMLGIALKVWSLNHWVNNNGDIVPR